jgi:small-conductance mechanosensitive channel
MSAEVQKWLDISWKVAVVVGFVSVLYFNSLYVTKHEFSDFRQQNSQALSAVQDRLNLIEKTLAVISEKMQNDGRQDVALLELEKRVRELERSKR